MNKELMNIDDLTSEEQEMMMTMLMKSKMSKIEQALKETVNTVKQIKQGIEIEKEETRLEFDKLKEDNQKTKEMVVSKQRVDGSRYEYLTLRDMGKSYRVSISNVMYGRLLRIVGIALQSRKGITEPHRKWVLANNSMAKTEISKDGYEYWVWNRDKVVKYVDKWLQENDHYEEFYSISEEKKLHKFINQLRDIYLPED